MSVNEIAEAEKRLRDAPAEIKKLAEDYVRAMVNFMRDIGTTGVNPPKPPRPMLDDLVARVTYASAVGEAFKVRLNWPNW